MRETYMTVSNVEFYDALCADAKECETNWTVSRHVKRGDRIPIYIGHPIMAIVAEGEASTDAELDDDPSSMWFNHYLVDIHNLRMLDKPITRATLMSEIPDWGWPRQPRAFARVPKQHLLTLERLLVG